MKEMSKDNIMTNLCYMIENDLKRANLNKKRNELNYYFRINDKEYSVDLTINRR